MDSSAKIRKQELKADLHRQYLAFAGDLAKNPVLELLVGYALIQYLNENPKDHPYINGWLEKQGLELALVGAISIQQLAPALPYLGGAVSSTIGTVKALAIK